MAAATCNSTYFAELGCEFILTCSEDKIQAYNVIYCTLLKFANMTCDELKKLQTTSFDTYTKALASRLLIDGEWNPLGKQAMTAFDKIRCYYDTSHAKQWVEDVVVTTETIVWFWNNMKTQCIFQ